MCNRFITHTIDNMARHKCQSGLVLFICIIVVLLVIIISWLFNISLADSDISLSKRSSEGFYNKRNERIKIYQSDEIFDPDEQPEYDSLDPDDNPSLFDPDQQPMLNDEEIGKQSNTHKPRRRQYSL
jgi:hypothetical protein